MALIPKICASFKNSCGIIVIKDITEEYNADTNTGGWGSPNVTTSDIDEAYINITYTTGLQTSTDVIDILPTTVTGSFVLAEISTEAIDGEYTIEYVLIDSDRVEYRKTIKVFSACVVRCCIDKMWAKYAQGLAEECSCTKTNSALEAEGLYRAMMSSTGCLNTKSRDEILKKLQRMCELENCNCK